MVSIASTHPPFSDRKSTRLNSSHLGISYAVFCLKKKKPPAHLITRERSPHLPRPSTSPRPRSLPGAPGASVDARRTLKSALAFQPAVFFNDPATTEIYTLSLHDALPI